MNNFSRMKARFHGHFHHRPKMPDQKIGEKSGKLGSQSGVALVVTLAVISLLMSTGLGLSYVMGKRAMESLEKKDLFQVEQWALSGIHFAMMVLDQDVKTTEIDSVQEFWADAEKMTAAMNAMTGSQNNISLAVTDELSKVQLNALIQEFPGHEVNPSQARILERLFSQLLEKASEPDILDDRPVPEDLVTALIDWMDSGDDDAVTGFSGAESAYYQNLEPPYLPANGPLALVDEICNVRGVDCDFLTKALNGGQESEKSLDQLFSVHGLSLQRSSYPRFSYPGKININTAPLPVLKALLPEGMEEMAQDLVAFRKERSETGDVFVNSLDKGWYKKVIGLSEKEQERLDNQITDKSHIFRIESSAEKSDAQVTMVAFVRRFPNTTDSKDGSGSSKKHGAGACHIIQIQRK